MPGDLHNYLSDMLSTARAKSGDELLVFSVEQVLKNAGPRQAEVLRRCAIPRWIDPSVLRVLRESDEGNERVLEKLRDYTFVRDLGDGRVAYHDQVRQTLLDEWRRDRPAELADLHRRLYSYFSQRTTPPGSTRKAMPLMPESTMISVVPMSQQADLFRREAIYHLLYADLERGMADLKGIFDELLESHRLAEAEALLQAANETPLGPGERRWVQYLRARALQASLSLDQAAQQLEALHALPDLTPDLAAEVSCALGEVYAETGQWARATELYRASLGYYLRSGAQRDAAETMLLLGEAYQGLGVSTGSWHVPTPASSPLLQALHGAWVWLLGLPFLIVGLVLGPRNRLLPVAEHCARYQNWLLIRLYNTARTWYAQSGEAFKRLNDPVGLLRANQRLADILMLYGYHAEARAQIEGLLAQPEARDPYRKAWLERSLAECHLAAGDVGSAQVLLSGALGLFQELGDVRREATILMLQGRAAMLAGNVEGALGGYQDSLNRFRTLRYATARERILHELRAWQRRPSAGPQLRERLANMVAAEPEKRYVGRFIRSALALLQIASLLAFPMALLLLAIFVPTTTLRELAAGVFSLSVIYDPLRTLGVLAALVPIYLAVYAGLATVVIYLLPLSSIEREQPDVIITTPESIARYDSHGSLALAQPWPSVRRWLALDRCLWDRPLPLYSSTFLEDAQGRDLPIDGITGWYGELQEDIGRRLAAAGQAVERRNLGYTLLKSRSGAAAALGTALLPIFTAVENGWLPIKGLIPATLYALLAYIVFSGVLILVPLAYWVANRPLKLQRALRLNTRWPIVQAGIGGLMVLLYLLGGGQALPIDALNYSTFVWGVYVLAEALVALLLAQRPQLRLPVVVGSTLLALLIVALPASANFGWVVANATRAQVVESADAGALPPGAITSTPADCVSAVNAQAIGVDAAAAYLLQGDCYAADGQWEQAAELYWQAAQSAAPGSGEQALAYHNLWRTAREAGDERTAAEARRRYDEICAASRSAGPICEQLQVKSR